MKIYSGTFGEDTIESNSLTQNLLKYPEIERQIVRQYPQYSLSYITNGIGNIAKEKTIGSNRYEWFVKGRNRKPATLTGTTSGTGAAGASFTFETIENYLNPNDLVRFKDGTQAIVIGQPATTSNGFQYTAKLNTNNSADTFDSSNANAGLTVGVIGTAFTERSEKGYENHSYPDKYVNYLGISRKAGSISGDAATDVTWIENKGSKLWFYTDEMETRDEFMMEREWKKWYGKSTVDTNGNPLVYDNNGKPIIMGDGVFEQIDSSNIDTYNGSLTEERITDFIAQLRFESGIKSKVWTVHTGIGGLRDFDRAMKDYIVTSGNLQYNGNPGGQNKLGGDFSHYRVLGHDIYLAENPLLSDPNIHGNDLAPSGFPKESHKYVFLNTGRLENGQNNLEVCVKGAGGMNRGMIVKYIQGMADNPGGKTSMFAATSRDEFRYEYLSHEGLIIRNQKASGILYLA